MGTLKDDVEELRRQKSSPLVRRIAKEIVRELAKAGETEQRRVRKSRL